MPEMRTILTDVPVAWYACESVCLLRACALHVSRFCLKCRLLGMKEHCFRWGSQFPPAWAHYGLRQITLATFNIYF